MGSPSDHAPEQGGGGDGLGMDTPETAATEADTNWLAVAADELGDQPAALEEGTAEPLLQLAVSPMPRGGPAEAAPWSTRLDPAEAAVPVTLAPDPPGRGGQPLCGP